MGKEMEEQWRLVGESKKYFSKKLTKEDIYVIVSEITGFPWIRTDEKIRHMVFKNTDGSELKVGLWNETIFDVISEINADLISNAFRAGKQDQLNDIKKVLKL